MGTCEPPFSQYFAMRRFMRKVFTGREILFQSLSHVRYKHTGDTTVSTAWNSFCGRSHNCGELRSTHAGQSVCLMGWAQYIRGGLFLTLRDGHGTVQVVVPQKLTKQVNNFNLESVLQINGTVQQRPGDQINKNMVTGEVEVVADDINLLNASPANPPFQISSRHEITEALRLEHRYLDLRNPRMQKNLRLRSKVVNSMRNFLCQSHGFVEVETPTLFRRTPGGAREFPVATHQEGLYYTLPQSPQQFKQLLMIGGIDRYMQVARCYRDETAKPDRQPEFTQLDLEMSFVTQRNIQDLTESLLRASWPDDLDPISRSLFPQMTYYEAMERYGSDKPDTRVNVELKDISDLLQDSSIHRLSQAAQAPNQCVKAFSFPAGSTFLSNKDIEQLKKQVSSLYPDVWTAVVKVKSSTEWSGNLDKQLGDAAVQQLADRIQLQSGDLLVMAAGEYTSTCSLLGRLRLDVANTLEEKGAEGIRQGDKYQFLWVVDFPLFLPKEDGCEGLESAHHPFTAPDVGEEKKVYTSPAEVRSQHYDLVLNGAEIGGGSIRIHDAKLQRYILEEVLKEDTCSLEHLLRALEHGCPPHGGIALGLDRLLAIMCGAPTIRDVIAFPKSGMGKCLLSKAPGPLSLEDREYYNLK